MKHLATNFLISVAVLFAAANASAVVVSDFVDLHQHYDGYLLLSEGQSYSITHDLTDDGVPDDNQVNNAWLKLAFADDSGRFFGHAGYWDFFQDEQAQVSGLGISGTFEVEGNIFEYDIKELGIGADGVADLNLDGLIEVTVMALDLGSWGDGDFYWKTSELFADISPVQVNEPGTLVMLGIGLLGLGLARRRKES